MNKAVVSLIFQGLAAIIGLLVILCSRQVLSSSERTLMQAAQELGTRLVNAANRVLE